MDLTVTVEVDVAVLYDTEEIVEGVEMNWSFSNVLLSVYVLDVATARGQKA